MPNNVNELDEENELHQEEQSERSHQIPLVSVYPQYHQNQTINSSIESIPRNAEISVGLSTHLIGGITLQPMVDSSSFYHSNDFATLKHRLDVSGYIYLRHLLPSHKILESRRCVCEALDRDWKRIDLNEENPNSTITSSATSVSASNQFHEFTSTPLLRARIAQSQLKNGNNGVTMTGYRSVTHDPRVLSLVEGEEVSTLFAKLFGQIEKEEKDQEIRARVDEVSRSEDELNFSPTNEGSTSSSLPRLVSPSTFDTKWVRVHGFMECTDEHTDYYRFEHWSESQRQRNDTSTSSSNALPLEDGARHMFTCWIPLGDYPLNHGTLVVAEGTHLLDGYSAGIYESDSKRELPPDYERWRDGELGSSSSLSSSSSTGIWRSSHFEPGDIVIFDIRLIHASTRNETQNYRISIDTRWKPTNEIISQQSNAFRSMSHHLHNQ